MFVKFSECKRLSINLALSFLLKTSSFLSTKKGFMQRIFHSQNVKYLSIKLLFEPICSFCLNELVGTIKWRESWILDLCAWEYYSLWFRSRRPNKPWEKFAYESASEMDTISKET